MQPSSFIVHPHRWKLAAEFLFVFIATPVFFYFYGTRWNIHMALWAIAAYAAFVTSRAPGFSWRALWHGDGWDLEDRKHALLRFLLVIPLTIGLTAYLAPDHLFAFPRQRPGLWLIVMFLYPILSVAPQELVFRSFFFRRYADLFVNAKILLAASAFCFGFIHVVFHNGVAPTLSLIGGLIFAHSYAQHRSLKWAAIEHATYGCMIFTVGIGLYFLLGQGWRHP